MKDYTHKYKIMHEREKTTRITDVIFVSTIIIMLVYVGLGVKEILPIWEGTTFLFLVFLGVIALIKNVFPRSKFTQWIEKKRW